MGSARDIRLMRAPYAELHAWSNFTFLAGASHPDELAARSAELGLHALALTDRDGLYGAVRFAKAAREHGVAAIVGAELALDDGTPLVLLSVDAGGYANLAELISRTQLGGEKHAPAPLSLDTLAGGEVSGLIALSGGARGRIARAIARGDIDAAIAAARALREIFADRAYVELEHHLRPEDAAIVAGLATVAARVGLPIAATNGVMYARPEDAPISDVLACIRNGTTLDEAFAAGALAANRERYLKSPAQMTRLFAPYPEAIANSVVIARQCTFRLERLRSQFPSFPLPSGQSSASGYLRRLVRDGARRRYATPLSERVERQLEYELGIIARLDLAGYFLVVWDIVRAARELGVLCQGRGSAANSVVCYVLGITAVDPIAGELLFERFLSEDRNEMPDIDIDFAHHDRERVIQYVYEKWGRDHAAMAAEVVTYRTRSAIRDVGKALGLSLDQVDTIAREYDARASLAQAAGAAGDAGDTRSPIGGQTGTQLLTICEKLNGFPRHMGIHSGGMIVTRDPITRVAPIERASMEERTIIQWDKDDLADVGLIKIDLLGLGILTLLRDAFALHARRYAHEIAEGTRAPLTLETIPANDAGTYAMLQRGDAIGVFQVESRAQQAMLPRMKPACFYDLVMQIAIIRPGPIQGNMIHPFLRRRAGLEPVEYPHPKLIPILERTLGVPLFQEQGMRMAIEAAGFTASEADRMRRAMGHKRSQERMAEIYSRLLEGMVANGIDRDAAERLYHMLEGFADYGFPESHARSFALLTYACAYLKHHEPAIFTAALLNAQPMGFYAPEVILHDARRAGVVVLPIAVNASHRHSGIDEAGSLRLGYHLVRDLSAERASAIEAALTAGPFADLIDFATRTGLTGEELEALAAADVFAPWFPARRAAIWEVRGLAERSRRGTLGRDMSTDEPDAHFATLTSLEETRLELWSTGVSRTQPIAHARARLDAERVLPAAALARQPNHLVCRVGGLVITRQQPGTAKGFVFLTLEDETGLVNIIVNPRTYERYRREIRQASALIVDGVLQREDGAVHVIARKCRCLDLDGLAQEVRSRDFQ
jgi:error-prone DNA polymerase